MSAAMGDGARRGAARRETRETRIEIEVELDGQGTCEGAVDGGFFDHMLASLARTAGWTLRIQAAADLEVDAHHAAEDVGIVLGRALRAAVGDGRDIARWGHALVPMDEALVEAAVDVSGRPYAAVTLAPPPRAIGRYHTEHTGEFVWGLARGFGLTVHLLQRAGSNAHHITEAAYKALGLALRRALAPAPGGMPSTKGGLFV